MDQSDQVLSQAEIDALLNGTSVTEDVPPPAAAQPKAAAPPPQPAPPVATATPPSGNAGDLSQLAERLARVEAAINQNGNASALQETVTRLQQSLSELAGQLQAMGTGLQGTVGYAAHENFVCSTCSEKGLVAARLTCTSCGSENWWGWYPPTE